MACFGSLEHVFLRASIFPYPYQYPPLHIKCVDSIIKAKKYLNFTHKLIYGILIVLLKGILIHNKELIPFMKLSLKKRLMLVGTFVSVFLFSFVSQAYATNLIGYPTATQAKNNWCWAATSVTILQYYGISVSQCSFYDHVKGTSGCTTDESESYGTVQEGIHDYGVSSWNHTGALSYSDVKNQIDNVGSPIYVSWKWNSATGGGHAVVIYGYDTYSGNDWIQHMNPSGGTKTSMLYTNVKGGSSYDRTWRWGLHGFNKYI
ncbi:hypothetical protein CD191_29565 [Paenibacillus odorifer]|uniref:Peptidase C39-like domain-containing protein n=2 Tax=Paenibacillus odorifer TaxID=189426 RepID=A0AAD0P5J0_9BACL|nr:hypothetical protein CD191_29565 [Paenibacillus odorifer]